MLRTLCLVFLLGSCSLFAQETFQNPILPGFHPDPSVCRVGEDYYLVNSSFEWYPGLPIYHSRDLVNWQLIGYGLQRPDQIVIPEGLGDSRGMYAPTIRYHEGTFYLICTCVQCEGNFYITATNPAGPWSDPVWLKSRGIDPSLFWDTDGRCYYTGHANISGVNDWPQKNGVWMQELDLKTQKLVGTPKQLTHGHATNARWTEGPHLYKIKGQYVLMVAEGGTGFHHAVTVHVSDSLWGPYVPIHSNPVMTHRHLGSEYPIHSVGHADLIETQTGDWWAVMLAKRNYKGNTMLARETFLTPVTMEMQEGIIAPVFNPGVGKLLLEEARPNLPWTPWPATPARDEFEGDALALEWNFLRSPLATWWKLSRGQLVLDIRSETADSLVNPSLIARRIERHAFSAGTRLRHSPKQTGELAGLILYRNSQNYLELLKGKDGLQLRRHEKGHMTLIAQVPYNEPEAELWVESDGEKFQFYYGQDETQRKPIGEPLSVQTLSDEVAAGFNGPFVGMYATSEGNSSKQTASFAWFEYHNR